MIRRLLAAVIFLSSPGPSAWAALGEVKVEVKSTGGNTVTPITVSVPLTGASRSVSLGDARSGPAFAAVRTPGQLVTQPPSIALGPSINAPLATVRASQAASHPEDALPAPGAIGSANQKAPVPQVVADEAAAKEKADAAPAERDATADAVNASVKFDGASVHAGSVADPVVVAAANAGPGRLSGLLPWRRADAGGRRNDLPAPASFDPAAMSVHLTWADRQPRTVPLPELAAVLKADPEYAAEFKKSGKIRLVLAYAGQRSAQKNEEAAKLRAYLSTVGLDRQIDVEVLPIPQKKEGVSAEDFAYDPALEERPAARTLSWRAWRARAELAWLGRQFRASITRPTREELIKAGTTRSYFIYANIAGLAAFYLPAHPIAFAVLAGFTLALKTFHGVWMDGWANFQDRLARAPKRGLGYQSIFNWAYGQIVSFIYRLTSWFAMPKTTDSPFSWHYWWDNIMFSVVGAGIGSAAGQSINDLYNNGTLSRGGRATLNTVRAGVMDVSGFFFKTGARRYSWLSFWVQQALDSALIYFASRVPPRPVAYVTDAELGASEHFRSTYPVKPQGPKPPARDRFRRALLSHPFVRPFVYLAGRVKWGAVGVAVGASLLVSGRDPAARTLSLSYSRALADPSFTRNSVLDRMARVTPTLSPEGWPLPATQEGGISVPILVTLADGRPGVFKPIRMDPNHPLYPYERMKLLRELVGSRLMRRFGVPTLEYSLGRTMLNGQELIGIASPFLKMRTPKEGSAEEAKLVSSDVFARGSIIDAWTGNTDRILNRGNLWMTDGDHGPSVVFGDFDQSFRDGVEVLGVPKLPYAFQGRANGAAAAAARAEIIALTDAEIDAAVDDALKDAGGFGAQSRDYFVALLRRNREALRAGALKDLPAKPAVKISPEASAAMADAVLAFPGRPGSDEQLDAAMKDLVLLMTHPHFAAPVREVLRRAVDARRAGRPQAIELSADRIDLLPPLMNFVYDRMKPDVAIQSRIGYYP